jgi:hypothetical protein
MQVQPRIPKTPVHAGQNSHAATIPRASRIGFPALSRLKISPRIVSPSHYRAVLTCRAGLGSRTGTSR